MSFCYYSVHFIYVTELVPAQPLRTKGSTEKVTLVYVLSDGTASYSVWFWFCTTVLSQNDFSSFNSIFNPNKVQFKFLNNKIILKVEQLQNIHCFFVYDRFEIFLFSFN